MKLQTSQDPIVYGGAISCVHNHSMCHYTCKTVKMTMTLGTKYKITVE